MHIISLGLGVQSTALYYQSSSSKGELPRADYAIFVDLGREKKATYDYLQYLLSWQQANNGIPIIVRRKDLYTDLLNTSNSRRQDFLPIPAYTKGENGSTGMLRRQCTGEYKVQEVNNAIRDLYNLEPGQRRPLTSVWLGITLDELERMNKPQEAWRISVYPFTGFAFNRKTWTKINWSNPMNRVDVLAWYGQNGLPVPPKSACVFCPYQSGASWAQMKREAPDDFAAAVKVDHTIRDSTKKGINNPCYLHKSLQPLDKVKFDDSSDLWEGECSGNCHI